MTSPTSAAGDADSLNVSPYEVYRGGASGTDGSLSAVDVSNDVSHSDVSVITAPPASAAAKPKLRCIFDDDDDDADDDEDDDDDDDDNLFQPSPMSLLDYKMLLMQSDQDCNDDMDDPSFYRAVGGRPLSKDEAASRLCGQVPLPYACHLCGKAFRQCAGRRYF